MPSKTTKKVAKPKKPNKWLSPIRASEELQAAISAYADKHRISVSELIREAICEKIGRPELAVTTKPGWPSGASRKKS